MIKILVIDDDKLIGWSLREILTQEGYEVDTFSTVKHALNQAKNNPYNLIFADLGINKENAIEMLGKVKKIQPSTIIIILTSYTRHQVESLVGNLNIFSIIEKPFRVEHISAVAKKVLDLQNSKKEVGIGYVKMKETKGITKSK